MADDDEIDILGDFSLSSLEAGSSLLDNSALITENSDLLKCDYTIHPQWLLDKPSANPDNWYQENSATSTPDLSDSDTMGHVSTENCITDESGWTEKEKNLLQRGLEIFGKSSVRLSQFVGSKSASEVRYYLKNFFTESLSRYDSVVGNVETENITERVSPDVLNSNQIPASIEEVIAAVSTGFPTVSSVPLPAKTRRRTSSSTSTTSCSPRKKSPNRKLAVGKKKPILKADLAKKKFKIKFKPDQLIKQKPIKLKRPKPHDQPKQDKINTFKIFNTTVENTCENITQNSPRKSLTVPVSQGEQIVTIENAEDDSSDVSIDVENDDSFSNFIYKEREAQSIKEPTISKIVPANDPEVNCSGSDSSPIEKDDLKSLNADKEVVEQLESLDVPENEVVLDKYIVSELEKVANADYFEGKTAKTPERYLRIRNHIINSWNNSKPNYFYKTNARVGLKNCGDVTCISRIHFFLEQIGAINFGCEQTKYERPLSKILQLYEPTRNKARQPKNQISREPTELGPRHKMKKKFNNDGEGGLTMVHGAKGEIIDTTVINQEPIKPRPYVKKPTIRLIYCRPFTPEKPQEYSVKISLSTLMLMDFHAHSYLTEVMGLVGGLWNYQAGTLKISCYEPCKNIASSTTHCDMCPVSQAKAAESIHNSNFEILGWFHSHPTFAPEPSQQDLDTQQVVQQWIGYEKPCIGVILSPFSANGALISSPYRCWMVDKKPNFEDQLVPYRFKVDVETDDFDLPSFLDAIRSILYVEDETIRDKRIPFHKPYFQDATLSHLEKFISSVNMHLAKSGTVSRPQSAEIIEGIKSLLKLDS